MKLNNLVLLTLFITVFVLSSCEVYQTTYGTTTSTKDQQSISKSGINVERQTKVTGDYNATMRYIEHRITLEKEDQKHLIANRYIFTVSFIVFLFFSAYLTYRYKLIKLKLHKK